MLFIISYLIAWVSEIIFQNPRFQKTGMAKKLWSETSDHSDHPAIESQNILQLLFDGIDVVIFHIQDGDG